MPHTKLKVTGVILIVYGTGNVLGGLAILAASLLAGEEISMMLETLGVSGSVSGALFLFLAIWYLLLAVLDFMAGISGIRFSDGKGNMKLCQIPSGVLIAIYSLNAIIRIFSGSFTSAMGSLLHVVVAVCCIVFSKKVDEASVGNLMLEDTPLFHMKDDY